jgi:O-6-methylguanine DNA methyltransferase
MGTVWALTIPSPLGVILAAATEKGLCRLQFAPHSLSASEAPDRLLPELKTVAAGRRILTGPNEHLRDLETQLEGYFKGKRHHPAVPVDFLTGTPFQQEVCQELCRIAYGATRTYGEVAEAVGRPRAFRAVAQACGRNPVPIVVPCHRVVARDGLGGYSSGLEIKKALLRLEGAFP